MTFFIRIPMRTLAKAANVKNHWTLKTIKLISEMNDLYLLARTY